MKTIYTLLSLVFCLNVFAESNSVTRLEAEIPVKLKYLETDFHWLETTGYAVGGALLLGIPWIFEYESTEFSSEEEYVKSINIDALIEIYPIGRDSRKSRVVISSETKKACLGFQLTFHGENLSDNVIDLYNLESLQQGELIRMGTVLLDDSKSGKMTLSFPLSLATSGKDGYACQWNISNNTNINIGKASSRRKTRNEQGPRR